MRAPSSGWPIGCDREVADTSSSTSVPQRSKAESPPPRDGRAVQYYAYPDWKFDRLREEEADGGFEAGADIRPDEWTTLRLDIDGRRIRAAVNGDTVLTLVEAKGEPAKGAVGLWVDIGSEGFFADLRVTAS